MRNAYAYGAVAVLAVVVLTAAAVLAMFPPGAGAPQNATTSALSLGGGIQTYVATFAGTMATCCTTTVSTSSASATATTTASGSGADGSYTYAPSSEVRVLSVSAVVSGGAGARTVSFSVAAQNTGTGNITVLEGGGSSLASAILSGGSVVTQVASPRCEIAEAPVPVAPGGSWTSVSPGCWSGFYYSLVGSGPVEVQLDLSWGGVSGGSAGSLAIDAVFDLGAA